MISPKDIHTFKEKHRVMLHVKEFICVLPHPQLRQYLSNYNITFPGKGLMSDNFTVIPCGCSTIAIEQSSGNLTADLHGPTAKPYTVGDTANQLDMMISIEFKPAGLFAITGINQNELTDRTLPLGAVNPALGKQLLDAAEKAESVCELVAELDALLFANLCALHHPQLMLLFRDIKKCAGNISVSQLSDSVHYSQRQLSRIFQQYVGLSAKSFSRMVRINSTFSLLKKSHNSLEFVSHAAGFYDLPHFIHDFKLVCGVSPGQYRERMSDFYSNPTRF